MSKSKELAKNTIILTVGKICTQFIGFFLLPLYTAVLSADEYGIVDLFNTYISLLLPIISWQFDQGLFRFLLDARNDVCETKKLFSSAVLLNILQCFLFSVLFLIFQSFINSPYKYYLLISVILNIFVSTLMQFSRGIGKTFNYAIGSFVTAIVTIVFNIIFIVILKIGAHGLFLATILAVFINCIYLTFSLKIWKYFSFSSFKISIIKKVGKYSIPFIPNQLSGWILNASDRTIIKQFIGLTANGIYSVANKFSVIISTFYGIFNLAWIEVVSTHYDDSDREEFLSTMITTILKLFSSISILMLAFMPFVFPIMIDSKFSEAYYHIPILTMAVMCQVMVGMYSAVYIALKKSSAIAQTTIIGAVINVVVNLLFIKVIGLYAASLSTLISFAVVMLYRRHDVKKYVKIKIPLKVVVTICLSFVAIICSYYYNHLALNSVSAVLAICFSIYTNLEFIKIVINKIKNIWKERKNENKNI